MKKIDLLSLAFLLFFSALCRHAAAFQDIHYDISAQFREKEKALDARQVVTFRNDSGRDLSVIYLRVYPNHRYSAKEKLQLYKYASYFKVDPYPDGFDPGGFELRGVRIKGEEAGGLVYSFEGEDQTVLKVVLPEPLKDGALLSLEIDFSLQVPHRLGRYGWHRRTFALNRWYPILSVMEKGEWRNPPDFLLHMPYVSEAATYRLTLEVPYDYVVASGCDEVSENVMTHGRKVLTLSSSQPLRELSLAISKDYAVYELERDGVTVRSYFFKKDEGAGRQAAAIAADTIKYYGENIGAFPYKQFSVASVYLGYGGSQNAGIVFIDSRAYQMPRFLSRYFDFLVSHETGHQWWYNIVGNDEYRELWLDEGINSYWNMRYLDDKYGRGARIIEMPRGLEHFLPNPTFESVRKYRYWYFAKKGLDQAVVSDISSFYEPSLIFTVAYGKGSAVVDMLAAYLGPGKFSEAARAYFQRYSYRNATVADFMAVCEEVSGEDLGWFFDQWLFGKGACDYAVTKEKGYLILRKIGGIAMPVETRLKYTDQTEEVVLSDGKEETRELPLAAGKRLKEACVDPARKVLDIDRVNNNFPRKVDVRLVPLYHGLYEIPLFLEDDRFSWITGPSFSDYGIGAKSSFQRPGDYILYAAAHYGTNTENFNSSVGFEKNNFLHRYMSWGVEFFNRDSHGDEEEDLRSYKVYLRRELALGYSLFELNSHVTLYLVHNQSLGKTGFLGAREEPRNLQYRQNKETIFGATFYMSNAGSFPDPSRGYKLIATQEVGGHALGGGDAFLRTALEWDKYFEVFGGHKLALRLKAGAGHPKDKYLFYLGSDRELRGYRYKDIKGSSMLLGSLEYRFPLLEDLDVRAPYHIFSLNQVQGVLFFDTGSAWFDRFNEPGFKKDVGLGLRFYFNVAGAAERLALRIDVARPLDSEDEDTRVWVGINQAF